MDRDAIIREVLSLPAADRQFVANVIAASLAGGSPLTPADRNELLRRIKMYEEHPETFETWESVKAKLAERRKAF